MELLTSNKKLRKFGCIFLGYLLFFGILFSKIYHHNVAPVKLEIIVSLFIIAAFIWPILFLPFHFIWNSILRILNWINTRILLGIIFFCLFSPIAFSRRLLKKDTLRLSATENSTYRVAVQQQLNDLRKPY